MRLNFIQVNGEANAEGSPFRQGRTIIISLGLVIEEVVDGGVDVHAPPNMVLKHEFPDGVALVHILLPRLRFAETASGERRIQCIVACEAMAIAQSPSHGMRARLAELRENDISRLMHP